MNISRTVILFALAAVAEIGGAWLIWQAVREDKAWWWAGLGIVALGAYGFIAAMQADANFGRVLAAYGGVFIAGSLIWGMIFDKFSPDRWDVIGALVALAGVSIIMFAPRAA
ncbi:YnfA family protein [Arthrobacter sp. HY1533]|uniref:YnfA family protein n=1 Tax=Arthrobacter sp. HY1533 TaxID=2970919 RepID=UPI0022BA0C16|nr:YnfA family protein [Arthrobacter sp. HY1533]